MITSDHITFDGDTAWMVEWPAPDSPSGWPVNRNDRPCDTCSQWNGNGMDDDVCDCADCRGTGRHVFDIEVPHEDKRWSSVIQQYRTRKYSVYVVEVLPITEGVINEDHVGMYDDGAWHVIWNDQHANEVPLPPAAEPGMWAVKLAEVQR